jgi:hypothetical protein
LLDLDVVEHSPVHDSLSLSLDFWVSSFFFSGADFALCIGSVSTTASSGFLLSRCDFLCLSKLVSPKQASFLILVLQSEFPSTDRVLDFCAASVRLFLLEFLGRWQWVFGSANASQKPEVPLEFLSLNIVGRHSSLARC